MDDLIVMMWITLIIANIQMWIVKDVGLVKYMGFIPWAMNIIILWVTRIPLKPSNS